GESGAASQINGGWITTLDLAFAPTVTISVDVWIATSSATDAGDSAELRVSLDGTQYGSFNGAHGSAVLRVDGGASASGMFSHSFSREAGTHTLTLGAWANHLTGTDEVVHAYFDNLKISAAGVTFT